MRLTTRRDQGGSMTSRRTTGKITVDGMTCSHCEQSIETAVAALDGVIKVAASAPLSEVAVTYDPDRASFEAIANAIRGAGYRLRGDAGSSSPTASPASAVVAEAGPGAAVASPGAASSASPAASTATPVYRILGLIGVIVALCLVLRYALGFTFLPTVNQSMGYGLLFVVGLITSLHCIAMCGGIVLSQGISRDDTHDLSHRGSRLVPSLLYNGGRVISYTVIGGIVGALGSLFSLSTALKGAMPVSAGAFMLFLGVRMLGIIPWFSRLKVRFPGLRQERVNAAAAGRGPFVIGLLNGLMPCGPLQTMQVYALGTGSWYAGALSMFIFSLGTIPLLLGFGAISGFLSAKLNRRMLKASGVLVAALGLLMFTRGLNLFGVALPTLPQRSPIAVAKLASGYQTVSTTVEAGQYHPLMVQVGVPLRWTISVKAQDLNGCNNPITIPQLGIRAKLVPGDNVIEFTPDRAGNITYTCWMGMISSTIRVVPDIARLTAQDIQDQAKDIASLNRSRQGGGLGGGCCGPVSPRFAGGRIPVDSIQVAKLEGGIQAADITVNDNGYTPAVVVVKRGVRAKIRFAAEKISSCNYIVSFPEYRGALDLSKGQLETPPLEVTEDFTFQCGMGMLHGYVKVVDDTANVDLKAIARQVAAYKPVGGGSCCSR